MSGFREALSFFTVIPVKDTKDMSGKLLYYPVIIAAIIGSASGAVFFLAESFLGGLVGSTLAFSVILVLSGFTHLDGVMDSGDALMARGTPEKRIGVIKDRNTGAGAIGVILVLYLPFLSLLSILSPFNGFLVIIFSEMASKLSYIFSLRRARTFGHGLAWHFSEEMIGRAGRIAAAGLLPFIVLSLILFPAGLLVLLAVPVISFAFRAKFYSLFGGINGDLLALNGELIRLIAVILMVILIRFLPNLPGLISLL